MLHYNRMERPVKNEHSSLLGSIRFWKENEIIQIHVSGTLYAKVLHCVRLERLAWYKNFRLLVPFRNLQRKWNNTNAHFMISDPQMARANALAYLAHLEVFKKWKNTDAHFVISEPQMARANTLAYWRLL